MVDVRTKDKDGKTICPQCKKHYIPDLKERDINDGRCIDEIYPQATATQCEQLITGICSDSCWDEYLGVNEEDEEFEDEEE